MNFIQVVFDKNSNYALYSILCPFITSIITLFIFWIEVQKNDPRISGVGYIAILGLGWLINLGLVSVLMLISYIKKEPGFRFSIIGIGISLLPIVPFIFWILGGLLHKFGFLS